MPKRWTVQTVSGTGLATNFKFLFVNRNLVLYSYGVDGQSIYGYIDKRLY